MRQTVVRNIFFLLLLRVYVPSFFVGSISMALSRYSFLVKRLGQSVHSTHARASVRPGINLRTAAGEAVVAHHRHPVPYSRESI